MVVRTVRTADGWKVDVRWWVAMARMAQAPRPPANSAEAAIRSLLAAMLRLDRARAVSFITDARNADVLFIDAPSHREPSGVLDAAATEMPLVQLEPGEAFRPC